MRIIATEQLMHAETNESFIATYKGKVTEMVGHGGADIDVVADRLPLEMQLFVEQSLPTLPTHSQNAGIDRLGLHQSHRMPQG